MGKLGLIIAIGVGYDGEWAEVQLAINVMRRSVGRT
jgi:hypothetical protein